MINKHKPNKPHSADKQPVKPKTPATARGGNKPSPVAEAGERVQKVLARAGFGSRREIERWIEEGRVRLNGMVALLGTRLNPGDKLEVNGRFISWQKFDTQPTRVLLYHKAVGEVVTRKDPEGRPTIFDQLPKIQNGRWVAVGRLDINTSGLILVTNNGELANCLMHPSTQIEREYAVRILGEVPDTVLNRLKQGVQLEDGLAKFDQIHFSGGEGANKWFYVVVSEGRNRLVRRLWESQNITVSRLMRVRYGPIVLPDGLRTQANYELSAEELTLLGEFAGYKTPPKTSAETAKPSRYKYKKPLGKEKSG